MDGIIDWMDMSLSKLQELVRDRDAWHAAEHGEITVREALHIPKPLVSSEFGRSIMQEKH